jgi:Tol biopolymer transport system component
VFASLRDGDYEIYSIRTDGHDVRKLTNNLADDAQPSW